MFDFLKKIIAFFSFKQFLFLLFSDLNFNKKTLFDEEVMKELDAMQIKTSQVKRKLFLIKNDN